MTKEERKEIEAAAPSDVKLVWLARPEGDQFEELQAGPCPLLGYDDQGQAECRVWEKRPYNCRRWGCFRPDPSAEMFMPEPNLPDQGLFGAGCLTARVQAHPQVLRALVVMQNAAKPWATAHGWHERMI